MTEDPTPPVFNQERVKARLRQLWQGEIPLAQAFWLYYFLGIVLLNILSSVDGLIGLAFGLMTVTWAGFMIKPVFMAADRYKGEKHWVILAKIAAVIVLIEVILDLVSF